MLAVLEKALIMLNIVTKLAVAIVLANLGLISIAHSSRAQNELPGEWQIFPDEQQTDDIPEELLRTEIITEARSPLTGEPLSAAEYAQLMESIGNTPADGTLISAEIRRLIQLLQIRRALKPIIPFIP